MNGAIVGCSKMKGCIENCVCFVPYTRIESHVNEFLVGCEWGNSWMY